MMLRIERECRCGADRSSAMHMTPAQCTKVGGPGWKCINPADHHKFKLAAITFRWGN